MRHFPTSRGLLIPLLGLLLWVATPLGAQADTGAFDEALSLILDRSFPKKEQAIERFLDSGDPRAEPLLRALLIGEFYTRKADGEPVLAVPGDGNRFQAVRSSADLGPIDKAELSRVTINNNMRTRLKGALAELSLAHPDPARRLAAVRELQTNLTPEQRPLLEKLAAKDTSPPVAEALAQALALLDLDHPEAGTRLAAVHHLEASLTPVVRAGLTRLLGQEPDPAVKKAAQRALQGIELRVKVYSAAETLFFGLSLGSVLVLAAIGLAITFGVMGVINMAHGELIMLGAYTTYVIQLALPDQITYSLLLAVPAAFLVSGLTGVLIERGLIRFLYGRPLETLLATFGLSLVLQQLVRSVFSPLNRSVETPAWMSGSWQLNEVLSLTLNRLYILVFCLAVFAALYLVLKRTRLGLQVRAVAQNRAMAQAMGVRSAWVDAMTFGLGSGIAGVAGVALSQLTNVGPNLGQAYIIDSFMVVVFGGVGNLWGTLVGGLGLGVVSKLLEPWSGAVLAKILVLVLIILFIQKRPRGLFPQKGRAADS